MTIRADRGEQFLIHSGDGAIETFSIQRGHRAELAGKRWQFAMRLLRPCSIVATLLRWVDSVAGGIDQCRGYEDEQVGGVGF